MEDGWGEADRVLFEILGQVSLGPNNSLILVGVQDKIFLLGVANDGISTIAQWDREEVKWQAADSAFQEEAGGFANVLSRVLRQRGEGPIVGIGYGCRFCSRGWFWPLSLVLPA